MGLRDHQTLELRQLALACLKSPSATVHTLLQAWTQYMRSPEHERERDRSQKNSPENEKAVNQKKRQVALKMHVHSLRHQLREMKRENAAKTHQQRWQALQKQLQDLTLKHGYGKLPLDGRILHPRYDLLLEAAATAVPEWREPLGCNLDEQSAEMHSEESL